MRSPRPGRRRTRGTVLQSRCTTATWLGRCHCGGRRKTRIAKGMPQIGPVQRLTATGTPSPPPSISASPPAPGWCTCGTRARGLAAKTVGQSTKTGPLARAAAGSGSSANLVVQRRDGTKHPRQRQRRQRLGGTAHGLACHSCPRALWALATPKPIFRRQHVRPCPHGPQHPCHGLPGHRQDLILRVVGRGAGSAPCQRRRAGVKGG